MNPSFEDIKTILFDFGGTIDSDGIPWKERFYPFYKEKGFRWPEEQFSKYFYASDDYLTDKKLKKVSYSETIALQVSLLMVNAGVYQKKIAEKISGKFLSDSLKNIKKNLPLIRKLSKKYKLGIVSNFYGNLPGIFHEIGFDRYFGAVIDSSNVGVIKPDPKIFETALAELKSDIEESAFVGDSLFRDMEGAKAMGMRHIWIKGVHSNKNKPCCKNDLVVRSFLELEEILL